MLSNKSNDTGEYNLKKKHIQNKVQYTFEFYTLYEGKKGPITAKTHGSSSWSSIQVKVDNAQKINGPLNVFGVYDPTMIRCMYILLSISTKTMNF